MLFYKSKLLAQAIIKQTFFLVVSSFFFPVSLAHKQLKPTISLWLIGENEGECLKDNAYIFFRYCREIYPNKKVYFIAKKKSIYADSYLYSDQNVVPFGSLKHIYFFLLSTKIIYSHAHSDVAYIQILKLFKRKCVRVFLQHGIIGLKRVHTAYRKHHNEMDIFIVSSEYEKKIILENFNFPENIIKITGLARYDNLKNQIPRTTKKILYMPTWRDWLIPKQNDATYFTEISKLLNSSRLNTLLESNSIQMEFYYHTNMASYQQIFKSNGPINIINRNEVSVQEFIKECSLLITDYSSISWDFYYLKKPVLFYQFDQLEYLLFKGSYMNMNRDLFGEVYLNLDSLLNGLTNYIKNNFSEKRQFSDNRSFYFKYQDNYNCKRIHEAIMTYSPEDSLSNTTL